MNNKKLFLIAAIPILLLLLFYCITIAFHLISAPSDISVVLGVLMLSAVLFLIFRILIYYFKNTFRK